ncbi:MAG TPA: hypothetical protein VNF05_00310 [Acidimicrobiales bacterium]|nr:hypothetical protein [Acidimicrobiales bacterium]
MKKIFTKVVVPSMLAVSTLGIGAVVATMPASAAATAKAPVTLSGTIAKAQAAKSTFWFKVGTKSYRVIYSSTTKFTKGTATSLVKGTAVKVTGKYVGKSTSVLKATSISA